MCIFRYTFNPNKSTTISKCLKDIRSNSDTDIDIGLFKGLLPELLYRFRIENYPKKKYVQISQCDYKLNYTTSKSILESHKKENYSHIPKEEKYAQ